MTERTDPTNASPIGVSRRRVLQFVGGATVGLAAFSGTASAHKSQFFGCSQVCSGTVNNLAVVKTESGEYECRLMETKSERRNQWYNYESGVSWCYEISGDDLAIVGMLENDYYEDRCLLCLNPNNCASNYYDDPEEILTDLRSDGTCTAGERCEEILLSTDCDVRGSNGKPPNTSGPANKESNGKKGKDKGK